MPGHLGTFNLDVQFGNWDGGFGFGAVPTESQPAYTSTVTRYVLQQEDEKDIDTEQQGSSLFKYVL